MKRLQFRNDSQVFQNRELALAFFANIANPEMGISDRFGDALYAEPMVVKYLDENGVEQVILAILDTHLENEECAELIAYIADAYFERTDE